MNRILLDRPVSVVLGGGSVRGLAHVGVLEALAEKGYRVSEIVGTSVGAVVLTFYAVVGLSLDELRSAGLSIRSTHLLWWAILRRASQTTRARYSRFAGVFPEYIGRLAHADFDHLHHGIERVGIVVYDKCHQQQIVCDSQNPCLGVEDAVRGSAALPGFFPAWKCKSQGRVRHLVDGGVQNRLPLDVLYVAPFQPQQILVVDISSKVEHRAENAQKIDCLRRRYPSIPVQVINANTLGGATVIYRSGYLRQLVDSVRRETLAAV